MTLLRVYRKFRPSFENVSNWSQPISMMLKKFQNDYGMVLALLNFIEGIISVDYSQEWDDLAKEVINILHKFAKKKECPPDYLYYKIPCPWIQIKALKILCVLSVERNSSTLRQLTDTLKHIIDNTNISGIKNKNNVESAILFEAIQVVIRYKSVINLDLQYQVLSIVVLFLTTVKDANIRYLALDSMTSILVLPGAEDAMNEQLKVILGALEDLDMSIRKRALDLLYLMCNSNNVGDVIEELLQYNERTDMQIREELVLKIAILAETFAPNLQWYSDVIIRLMSKSGDYITDDIWWRLCQVVTGFSDEADEQVNNKNKELQQYAIDAVVNAAEDPNIHKNLIKLIIYIASEFGIRKDKEEQTPENSERVASQRQVIFEILAEKFKNSEGETKCMLLSFFGKLASEFIVEREIEGQIDEMEEEMLNMIFGILEQNVESMDVEVQKRSIEYLTILQSNNLEVIEKVFFTLPLYPRKMKENNPLLNKMMQMLTKGKGTGRGGNTDPTLYNEGSKLIKNQMKILNSKAETKGMQKMKKGGAGYDDLFIETALIKFDNLDHLINQCRSRIAWEGKNIMLTPENITLPKFCLKEFKNLLSEDVGVLYEDNHLRIDYKSSYDDFTGKVAIQFVQKAGLLDIQKVNVISEGGLEIQTSGIKKFEHAQIMMNLINSGWINSFPTIQLEYSLNNVRKTLIFNIPVFVHKYISKFDLDEARYMKVWKDYTSSSNDSHFKLDEFIKNPSPPSVPLQDVMKMIGKLLVSVLGLKVAAWPNPQDIKMVYGVGVLNRKFSDDEKKTNIPIMVEFQCFDSDPEMLRLSIRTGGNVVLPSTIYQILTFFFSV